MILHAGCFMSKEVSLVERRRSLESVIWDRFNTRRLFDGRTRVVNCGDLGVALVRWATRQWDIRWVDVEDVLEDTQL